MSATATTDVQGAPTDADLLSVRDALSAALKGAEAAGVDRRHFRTAIWHATITSVLAAAELPLAIAVLEDRAAAIRGYGTNGDSPIRIYSPEDAVTRFDHAVRGAEIIDAYLFPVIESIDDQGRDGLSAALVTIFDVLREWWGPVHLRRTLSEQIRALRTGGTAPIAPSEPTWPNKRRSGNSSGATETAALPRSILVYATVGSGGRQAAVAVDIRSSDGRRESRTISMPSTDLGQAIPRMAEIALFALTALGPVHPEDKVQMLSDVDDPCASFAVPADLSEKLAGALRDRQTTWVKTSSAQGKEVERARQAAAE